jgi:hypothetical protein
LLFPAKDHLVVDLIRLADVNTKQRAHEVTMKEFDKLCCAYVELAATLNLPLQPLQVNRPNYVADLLRNPEEHVTEVGE